MTHSCYLRSCKCMSPARHCQILYSRKALYAMRPCQLRAARELAAFMLKSCRRGVGLRVQGLGLQFNSQIWGNTGNMPPDKLPQTSIFILLHCPSTSKTIPGAVYSPCRKFQLLLFFIVCICCWIFQVLLSTLIQWFLLPQSLS